MTGNNGVIILSILIPSIPSRKASLRALKRKLKKQIEYCDQTHPTLGKIELIVNTSKPYLQGGPSIGRKRQQLLEKAKGVYLCYLDDDDDISPNYCETLLRLCNEGADVCTFRSFVRVNDFWSLVDMSLDNDNEQLHPHDITLRTPWHICPVKTEIAKQFEFSELNYGEDYDWFERVLSLCATEMHTNEILHNYNHGDHSESDKIVKHELQSKQ